MCCWMSRCRHADNLKTDRSVFEMSGNTPTTGHHLPEVLNLQQHHHQNPKPCTVWFTSCKYIISHKKLLQEHRKSPCSSLIISGLRTVGSLLLLLLLLRWHYSPMWTFTYYLDFSQSADVFWTILPFSNFACINIHSNSSTNCFVVILLVDFLGDYC